MHLCSYSNSDTRPAGSVCSFTPSAGSAYKLFILAEGCHTSYPRKHLDLHGTSEQHATFIFRSWTQKNDRFLTLYSQTPYFKERAFTSWWVLLLHTDTFDTLLPIGELYNHFKMCSAVWGILCFDLYFTSSHSPLTVKCLSFNTYFILHQCDFDLVILKT